MGRNSNDDRSDSMNPNNDAYAASENNRNNQSSSYDDDDDFTSIQPSSSPQHIVQGFQRRDATVQEPVAKDITVSVEIGYPAARVQNLYLLCLLEKNKAEKKIKVDALTVDSAIREAEALWDAGGTIYMALYDKETVFLERSKVGAVPPEIAKELSYLGDLQSLIDTSHKYLKSARHAMDSCLGQSESYQVAMCIKEFGSWKAANNVLRLEMDEKIQSINNRGFELTLTSVTDAIVNAKSAEKASASAKWIRDFQQGRVHLDTFLDAIQSRQQIVDIRF